MDKTTEIYRYGNYITKVVGKDALKQWIIDNCSYNNAVGEIPPGTPFAECLAIARDRGFTFNTTVSEAITQKEVGRLANILVYARFPGWHRTWRRPGRSAEESSAPARTATPKALCSS